MFHFAAGVRFDGLSALFHVRTGLTLVPETVVGAHRHGIKVVFNNLLALGGNEKARFKIILNKPGDN